MWYRRLGAPQPTIQTLTYQAAGKAGFVTRAAVVVLIEAASHRRRASGPRGAPNVGHLVARGARQIVLTETGHAEVARIRDKLLAVETSLLADLQSEQVDAMLDGFERISAFEVPI